MVEVSHYLHAIGPLQVIGMIGFLVYIFAFGCVQLGYLDGNSLSYSLYNVLAASLVAISLIAEFNLASAFIQGSWILIGLTGALRRSLSGRFCLRMSAESPASREMG